MKLSLTVALSLVALVAGTAPVDLCATANGGCDSNAVCYGGYGSVVTCVCNNGYFKNDAGICTAVNACATNNGGCSPNAVCATTLGTWQVTCTCNAPFFGDGWSCRSPPVDLCQTNNGGCGTDADCYGGLGDAVTCVCHNGYYKDSTGACVAVNACATNNGGCSEHATCATTLATWDVTCTCVAPYEGEGHYCALPAEDNNNGGSNTGSNGGDNGGSNGGPQFGNWDCPPQGGFWDWRYPQPTCTQLTVTYPADLPDGQSNDVNVRIHTANGDVTLNFHNNLACWTGTTVFDLLSHPLFPTGATQWSVVWVQVGGSNCHWHGDVQCGTNPETPEEPGTEPPFTWDWEYPTPTCEGVTVTYPSNIPDCQANDANVRIVTNLSSTPITLNFHLEQTDVCVTWSGTHVFDITGHPNFPAGATSYTIQWVQIGGTNYHWEGSVTCP